MLTGDFLPVSLLHRPSCQISRFVWRVESDMSFPSKPTLDGILSFKAGEIR